MKVVVTGSSGFIGGRVCEAFSKKYEVLRVSSRNSHNYQEIPAGDVCIHLAANSVIQSVGSFESEWDQTKRILQKIVARRFSHVIYASSGSVYGDLTEEAHRESGPTHPTSSYSRVKLEAEHFLFENHNAVSSLRLANIIGHGMNSQSVVVDILKQFQCDEFQLRNKTSKRDYTHVSDVVNLMELLILQKPHGIYNVGTGVSLSVEDIVNTLAEIRGQAYSITETEPLKRISCIQLNVEKINASGWRAEMTLKDSLREMLSASLQQSKAEDLSPSH